MPLLCVLKTRIDPRLDIPAQTLYLAAQHFNRHFSGHPSMNNLIKYLPMLLLLGLLVCIVLLLTLNSNLDRAVERLEQAELKIDSSFISLRSAKLEIDSVRNGIATFSVYVRDIQGRVEILDLNERMLSDRFKGQGEKLRLRLKELYKEVEQTGKELPEVPVVRKNN